MIRQLELVLLPEEAADQSKQLQAAAAHLGIPVSRITRLNVLKRSIDARGRAVKIRIQAEIFIDELSQESGETAGQFSFSRDVSSSPHVFIAGFGPAGMFAALKLIESGRKPVIFERGKDVRNRRRDLAAINR